MAQTISQYAAANPGDVVTAITGDHARGERAGLPKVLVLGSLAGLNAVEGSAIASTGEIGGTKFLREDGDGTSSWQTIAGGGAFTADVNTRITPSTPIILNQAAGNEAALTLNYTVNKASGNDTGLLINMIDTASPGTSLLADFQVGGVSKVSINNLGKVGINAAPAAEELNVGGSIKVAGYVAVYDTTWGINPNTLVPIRWPTVVLRQRTTGVLMQNFTTTPQVYEIYNTSDSLTAPVNYERGFMRWATSVLEIGTENNGTGAGRDMRLLVPSGNIIQIDKTTEDNGFINFKASADADAISAISTLATSGATTHHIQIEINGITAWIAASTTDPT